MKAADSAQRFILDHTAEVAVDRRTRDVYWLRLTSSSANLKLVLCAWSIVLLIAVLVFSNGWKNDGLFGASLYVAYLAFCGYLSNYHFRLASLMVAVPSLLLSCAYGAILVLAYLRGDIFSDIALVWLLTIGMASAGLYAAVSARSFQEFLRRIGAQVY